jgi:PAS domain S-box-containing protein
MFENTNVGIGVLREQRIVQANKRLAAMFGYEPQEFIGLRACSMCSLHLSGDAAGQGQGAHGFPDSEKCGSFAAGIQFRRKDGLLFFGRCGLTWAGLSHASNDVVWVVEDITESKRREEELRRFRMAMDVTADAIYLVDRASMRFIDVNEAACRMQNRTREELLALGPEGVLLVSREELERIYDSVIAGDPGVAPVERLRQRKDGTQVWVEIRRRAQRFGENWMIVTVARDITERKRGDAQQRLAASVFDNVAEGIMITDKDNSILSVNRAFTEITGYSPEEAIGRNPRMLNSGWQPDTFYTAMWASIRETGRWQGEVWDRRKDGRPYCELLSIAVIRDDQGKIAQHCAIFSDITKLKLTEAELMALNTELEARVDQRTAALDHANKELETFSYSVSHDLRAPLRHIGGFSAIVLKANEGKLDAVSVDYLKRINAASERMGLLIDDLLALSRVSRQELNKRNFDLSDLAVQAANSLVEAHPEREVRVTVRPEMKARGDPGLARIVLENLIGNAWKFTARTSEPWIEVGLEERDGETVYYVRDNGAGFDMKYAHKLFAPFQRLHTDREFQGTGIGLSIVQRIVARHGGRIWAEAEAGKGATFYFTLGKNGRPA